MATSPPAFRSFLRFALVLTLYLAIYEEAVAVKDLDDAPLTSSLRASQTTANPYYEFFAPADDQFSAWDAEEEENITQPQVENLPEQLIELAEREISHRQDGARALKLFRLAGLLGHSGAMSTAAALLLSGESSLKRDVSRAVHHLAVAARAGQPDANALLGFLYASGIADRYGLPKSEAAALLHWGLAAGARNVYSMTALGFRYLHGINVRKSCPMASSYYQRAAQAIATDPRHWPAPQNFLNSKPPLPDGLEDLGRMRLEEDGLVAQPRGSDDVDIVQYFRHAAKRGDLGAMTALGALHYYGGYGIVADEAQAREILEAAAEAGGREAHSMLGYIAMREKQNETALWHFRNSAPFGNTMAHYALGMCYLHGLLGLEKDYTRAAMHFELATETGHADASFQLGLLLWNGRGRKKDLTLAYEQFKKAADLGSIQAKLNIGTIILNGSPLFKAGDCEEGVKYLKEVAEEGEWKTLFDLASQSLENGDQYGALYRYMQAAYVGIEIAQFNAALILERSSSDQLAELSHWDRERRLTEAHQLYRYSGIQGHTDSLIRAGNVLYTEKKNYEEAAHIYELAAALKNAEGMVSLSLMHAVGLGVRKDRQLAVRYLATASREDQEAIAPATVALIGLRVYWAVLDFCSKLGRWCEDISLPELGYEPTTTEMGSQSGTTRSVTGRRILAIESLSSFAEDLALVGALFLALCAILVVRGKRLARQPAAPHDHDS
ncbi:Protein sel-1-like [Gracilariopsis chorda]|uniref:Protein sel-1-like n=1 Tax=Gracilariopsis chorda TaxID=448386 RepID=A0A2V3IRG6_9FLOR|nr:Protein sel-1-like [Gracilariopsis chorda]|eukprot:PXF44721.1 Protein sel-1-like [Gracilariopsis chorda]